MDLKDAADHRSHKELQKDKRLYGELLTHLKIARDDKYKDYEERIGELRNKFE